MKTRLPSNLLATGGAIGTSKTATRCHSSILAVQRRPYTPTSSLSEHSVELPTPTIRKYKSKPDPRYLQFLNGEELPKNIGERTFDGLWVQSSEGKAGYTFFSYIHLRDACDCSKCVDPHSKQKLFSTSRIPLSVRPKRIWAEKDGRTGILWENDIPGFDDHQSIYNPASLTSQLGSGNKKFSKLYGRRVQWDASTFRNNYKSFPMQAYLDDRRTLTEVLKQLWEYGLVFLHDVPSVPESVAMIAERIGPLRNSFYGSTWDVRSVAEAKNVAYTNSDLGLHMDLLYMRDPPGLQLLHCIQPSHAGGESLFADSFRAAGEMHKKSFRHFKSLATYPVTYHYENAGQTYKATRCTIEARLNSSLFQNIQSSSSDGMAHYQDKISRPNDFRGFERVNFSPPFQGPLLTDLDLSRTKTYIEAVRKFTYLVESPRLCFEKKLEAGECAIFVNRRILHARKAFTVGGNADEIAASTDRWLRGAYVDEDAWMSAYRNTLSWESGAEQELNSESP